MRYINPRPPCMRADPQEEPGPRRDAGYEGAHHQLHERGAQRRGLRPRQAWPKAQPEEPRLLACARVRRMHAGASAHRGCCSTLVSRQAQNGQPGVVLWITTPESFRRVAICTAVASWPGLDTPLCVRRWCPEQITLHGMQAGAQAVQGLRRGGKMLQERAAHGQGEPAGPARSGWSPGGGCIPGTSCAHANYSPHSSLASDCLRRTATSIRKRLVLV